MGVLHQLKGFLAEHPGTALVVIDTLQRVRQPGENANPYASDYRDITALKRLAEEHGITILLIHHLRKMNDEDPLNMISGTTGISGATDSSFVLILDAHILVLQKRIQKLEQEIDGIVMEHIQALSNINLKANGI